jgi:prevent-host-death family protein
MESVPVRELQQHASAVLRRVRAGERVAVTDRGTVVAVLVPPSDAGGAAGLLAAGRVRPATAAVGRHNPVRVSNVPTGEVLDDLRSDTR